MLLTSNYKKCRLHTEQCFPLYNSKSPCILVQWMPLVEFVEQPLIQGDEMFKKIIDICIARIGKRYCGLSVHPLVSKFDGKMSSLYYNIIDDQDSNCCTWPTPSTPIDPCLVVYRWCRHHYSCNLSFTRLIPSNVTVLVGQCIGICLCNVYINHFT